MNVVLVVATPIKPPLNGNYGLWINTSTSDNIVYKATPNGWLPIEEGGGGGFFRLVTSDTSTIILTGEGTRNLPLEANIQVSSADNNIVEVFTEKNQGLFVQAIKTLVETEGSGLHIDATDPLNVIVKLDNPNDRIIYARSGESWVNITANFNELKELIQENSSIINELTEIVQNHSESITNIEENIVNIQESITNISNDLDPVVVKEKYESNADTNALTDARANKLDNIGSYLTNIEECEHSAVDIKLILKAFNPQTNTTTDVSTTILAATHEIAGALTASDKVKYDEYQSEIANNAQQIASLQGAVIYLGHTSLTTQELESQEDGGQASLIARAEELGYTNLRQGYTIIDASGNDWWYNGELSQWINVGYSQISIASNTMLGVVKGSEVTLQVGVNADGTMVINGIDAVLANKLEESDFDLISITKNRDGKFEVNTQWLTSQLPNLGISTTVSEIPYAKFILPDGSISNEMNNALFDKLKEAILARRFIIFIDTQGFPFAMTLSYSFSETQDSESGDTLESLSIRSITSGDNHTYNTFIKASRSSSQGITEATITGTRLLNQSDVVNNLTSTDTTKALSAAQGKELNDSTVKLTGNQDISGVKNFTTIPQTSVVPTAPGHLVNKEYVDSLISQGNILVIQNDPMYSSPDADAEYEALVEAITNNTPIIFAAEDARLNYVIHTVLRSEYDSLAKTVTLEITNTSADEVLLTYFYDNNSSHYTRSLTQKNFLDTQTGQNVSGIKTFNTLPQSSVTPTLDTQLVNKKYVDARLGTLIVDLPYNTTPVYYMPAAKFNELFEAIGQGRHIVLEHRNKFRHLLVSYRGTGYTSEDDNYSEVLLYTKGSLYDLNNQGFTIFRFEQDASGLGAGNDAAFSYTEYPIDFSEYVTLNSNQTITGIKTFTALPKSTIAPTSNDQLVNKAYVDSKIGQGGSNPLILTISTLNSTSVPTTEFTDIRDAILQDRPIAVKGTVSSGNNTYLVYTTASSFVEDVNSKTIRLVFGGDFTTSIEDSLVETHVIYTTNDVIDPVMREGSIVNASGSTINVIDSLTSMSRTDALSAYQGRVLNETTVKLTGNQAISGEKIFANPTSLARASQRLNGITYSSYGAPSILESVLVPGAFENQLYFHPITNFEIKGSTATEGEDTWDLTPTNYTETQKRRFIGGHTNSDIRFADTTILKRVAVDIDVDTYCWLNMLAVTGTNTRNNCRMGIYAQRLDSDGVTWLPWEFKYGSQDLVKTNEFLATIPHSTIQFDPRNTATNKYQRIRVLFYDFVNNDPTSTIFRLWKLMWFGVYPSTPKRDLTTDELGNVTFMGKVTASAGPTANMDLATKQYVDNNGFTPDPINFNIPVSSWVSGGAQSPYMATINVSNITTNSVFLVSVSPYSENAAAKAQIYSRVTTVNAALQLRANYIPETDLLFFVEVLKY